MSVFADQSGRRRAPDFIPDGLLAELETEARLRVTAARSAPPEDQQHRWTKPRRTGVVVAAGLVVAAIIAVSVVLAMTIGSSRGVWLIGGFWVLSGVSLWIGWRADAMARRGGWGR